MPKESKSQKKISHHRRILTEQTIQERLLLPGLVVRFAYNKPTVYDRRPLLFVFHNDGNLVYGLNLNYLHESRVQRFAKLAQSLTPITMENLLGVKEEYPRLQLSVRRKASAVDGKLLYKTIIPRDRFYRDAYRTYKLSLASSMKLVNYDWDVIRNQKGFGKTTAEAVKRTGLIDDGDVTEGI
tara:strand:- start:6740 stop:7288 length:549 start_codon:yes stop_codon:yes gene_type:complete